MHQIGSTLNISSAYSIYGIGSINDHVNCSGILSATSGYFLNLNGGLSINGDGNVNLDNGALFNGTLYINDANSGMNGGSLTASYLYVGYSGTGTFTQNGGISHISPNGGYQGIYLGYNSGDIGTYNLINTGILYTSIEFVGINGIGFFNQTGGTNSTNNQIYIGYSSSSSGTYNLSGSGYLSAHYEYIGAFWHWRI